MSIGLVVWNLLVAFVAVVIVPWPFRIFPLIGVLGIFVIASRLPFAVRLDSGGILRFQKGLRHIDVPVAEIRSVEEVSPAADFTPLVWRPRRIEFKWEGDRIWLWIPAFHLGELVATLAAVNPDLPPFYF